MVVWRYEIHLWVFNSISHKFAALTREISIRTQEDEFYISKQPCICLFYKPTNNEVFPDFPKISKDFQNVVRRSYECFRTCLKICKDFGRLPRKIQQCFDLILINLWLIHTHLNGFFFLLFSYCLYNQLNESLTFSSKKGSQRLPNLEFCYWHD